MQRIFRFDCGAWEPLALSDDLQVTHHSMRTTGDSSSAFPQVESVSDVQLHAAVMACEQVLGWRGEVGTKPVIRFSRYPSLEAPEA